MGRSEIDVLLPTFNRRKFLPRAIECIREQTFADWRLVVVNDGGEDVADIVADAGDSRIAYFNRPHLGKAAQLNFALAQTAAPYVAYMDDDDEVFPIKHRMTLKEYFGLYGLESDVDQPRKQVKETAFSQHMFTMFSRVWV